MTPTIEELRSRLNEFKSPPLTLTIEEVFKDWPEGDFHWEEDDPGDPHTYYCDDCKLYHKTHYNWEFRRKDDKRSITLHTGDEDGNWDIDSAWEEGEDATDILTTMQNEIDEYFKGWAMYYLDLAESGDVDALKAAEENIEYLYMGAKHE